MTLPALAVSTLPLSDSGETSERLLATALRLFAEEGLKGVSLRRVVAAAGAANLSALHYHFGSRQAVVEAIAQRLFLQLRATALPRLRALDPRSSSVRSVLEAMFRPVIELRSQGESGRYAVQFLARLSWEFGAEGQALSASGLQPIAEEALQRLEKLLPLKDGDHLRLQLLMAMTNVFHGLADFNYVRVAPFGPRRLLGAGDAELREKLFFDYLEGGLCGAA